MKTVLTLTLSFLVSIPVLAVERSDLSPAAQRFIPEEQQTILHLKNGKTARGVVLSETDDAIVINEQKGSISFQRTYPKAEISEVETIDVCHFFARGLRKIQLNSDASADETFYTKAITLMEEFLTHCEGHEAVEAVQTVRDRLQEELDSVRNGLKKIDGVWLNPVEAAIAGVRDTNDKLGQLRDRFSGIERPGFRGNEKAANAYRQLLTKKRELLRAMPGALTKRIPDLLEKQRIEDAVGELSAFLQYWLNDVIQRGSGKGADSSDMDFSILTRLQKDILSAYRSQFKDNPKASTILETNGMVRIPGGYFLRGSEDATLADDRFPLRIVSVDPFFIDKYEVSNKEYREFLTHVQQTGDSSVEHPDAPPLKDHTPEGWKHPELSGGDQPVVGVDWFDAYAYAKWKGKRLPTEAEWELAAKGYDSNEYPWGNDPKGLPYANTSQGRQTIAAQLNRNIPPPPPPKKGFMKKNTPPPRPKITLPVTTWPVDKLLPEQAWGEAFEGQAEPRNPAGLFHMSDNVCEWVFDRYGKDYYGNSPTMNPTGPEEGDKRVYRGGSYLTGDLSELSTTRRFHPTNPNEVKGLSRNGKPMIGFRCVRDAGH